MENQRPRGVAVSNYEYEVSAYLNDRDAFLAKNLLIIDSINTAIASNVNLSSICPVSFLWCMTTSHDTQLTFVYEGQNVQVECKAHAPFVPFFDAFTNVFEVSLVEIESSQQCKINTILIPVFSAAKLQLLSMKMAVVGVRFICGYSGTRPIVSFGDKVLTCETTEDVKILFCGIERIRQIRIKCPGRVPIVLSNNNKIDPANHTKESSFFVFDFAYLNIEYFEITLERETHSTRLLSSSETNAFVELLDIDGLRITRASVIDVTGQGVHNWFVNDGILNVSFASAPDVIQISVRGQYETKVLSQPIIFLGTSLSQYIDLLNVNENQIYRIRAGSNSLQVYKLTGDQEHRVHPEELQIGTDDGKMVLKANKNGGHTNLSNASYSGLLINDTDVLQFSQANKVQCTLTNGFIRFQGIGGLQVG